MRKKIPLVLIYCSISSFSVSFGQNNSQHEVGLVAVVSKTQKKGFYDKEIEKANNICEILESIENLKNSIKNQCEEILKIKNDIKNDNDSFYRSKFEELKKQLDLLKINKEVIKYARIFKLQRYIDSKQPKSDWKNPNLEQHCYVKKIVNEKDLFSILKTNIEDIYIGECSSDSISKEEVDELLNTKVEKKVLLDSFTKILNDSNKTEEDMEAVIEQYGEIIEKITQKGFYIPKEYTSGILIEKTNKTFEIVTVKHFLDTIYGSRNELCKNSQNEYYEVYSMDKFLGDFILDNSRFECEKEDFIAILQQKNQNEEIKNIKPDVFILSLSTNELKDKIDNIDRNKNKIIKSFGYPVNRKKIDLEYSISTIDIDDKNQIFKYKNKNTNSSESILGESGGPTIIGKCIIGVNESKMLDDKKSINIYYVYKKQSENRSDQILNITEDIKQCGEFTKDSDLADKKDIEIITDEVRTLGKDISKITSTNNSIVNKIGNVGKNTNTQNQKVIKEIKSLQSNINNISNKNDKTCVYYVKKGDTLSKITYKMYNSTMYGIYKFIADLNNIKNPNFLKIGQIIHLPIYSKNNICL